MFPGDTKPLLTPEEIQARLQAFWDSGEKDWSVFNDVPESQQVNVMYPHRISQIDPSLVTSVSEDDKAKLNQTYGKISATHRSFKLFVRYELDGEEHDFFTFTNVNLLESDHQITAPLMAQGQAILNRNLGWDADRITSIKMWWVERPYKPY